ncbi:YceI family protein [Marinomonas posidonica]|uniref:YceI family protein n=1 Tax=Marinomonas posidonica (strain CECT 7376 / NCIMB 14433 / IVIA-Po-181) TaxID=491952 RepID=F6CRP9_MARPP|nr:YceI family protein [Marinomonas posidonica]AEF53812.1 YceI family protein [Marinomonas posidonica IVIA-Po-181]
MKAIAISALALASSLSFAADYKVDTAHSAVIFKIGHLGVSTTVGRFDEFSGDFSFADDGKSGSATLTIQADSVDTNHDARDKHLRSPDFLDVKQFPTLTFTSSQFDGDTLTGDLTLHGVTKAVTFDVEKVGEGKDPWGGYRSGFEATTTINRSDFGITYFIPGVTDTTEIEVYVEGIRQ